MTRSGRTFIIALALAATGAAAQTAPRVECRGTGPAVGREFVLDQGTAPGRWRLSYRDTEHPAWLRVTLEGAEPVIEPGGARLQYKNANGGRQVDMTVTPAAARLDVYVDYGLEVNVDPNLDPDIDRMTTDGPLTTLECRVVTP